MIEPTDEMADAVDEVWVAGGNARQAAAAVLAIVERDLGHVGACSSTVPRLTEYGDLWCQLRHGHTGDHEMGPTRWRERP